MNRRFFLKVSLGGAGALMIGCGATPPWGGPHVPQNPEGAFDPNVWIRIHPDERIEVAMTKAEMGQGSHTLAAILVAEELEVPVAGITPIAAVGAPYEAMGMQITGGSSSTPDLWMPMRKAGAAARMMLVAAAAKTWGVPVGECTAEAGAVKHGKSNRSLTYGKLTAAAAQIEPPEAEAVKLKAREDFKVIGTAVDRVDLREKVTGAPIFGIDARVPDMVNAAIVPPPVFGAEPTSIDDGAAREMKGVIDVFAFEFGVAVIAERYWQAARAAQALKVTWSASPTDALDSRTMLADMVAAVAEEGPKAQASGDLDAAFEADGAKILEATYTAPYLAHATLEPQTATAWVRDDAVDVWTGTQAQTAARNTTARLTGVDPANVTLHNVYLGGGFGRRGCIDAVIQAVLIARRVRRPVKLTWSRPNDMHGWYYRPQMVARMKGSLQGEAVTGLYAHCASQTPGNVPDMLGQIAEGWLSEVMLRMMGRVGAQLFDSGTVPNVLALEGMTSHAYTVPNQRIDFTPVKGGVPVLFWRSVGHSFNAFAKEGFIDELAHAAGVDGYTFRKKLLPEDDRRTGVLDAVAHIANWKQKPPEGVGRGIATHFSFGSFVGMVTEATVVDGEIRVQKIYCVADCGQPINLDQIKAQLESGIIFGLSAALWGRIDLVDGKVQQSNYNDYRILRFDECPEIVCDVIMSTHAPTGIGEPGLPPVAPTLANAIFEVTGERLRDMPLADALAAATKADGAQTKEG